MSKLAVNEIRCSCANLVDFFEKNKFKMKDSDLAYFCEAIREYCSDTIDAASYHVEGN